MQVPPSPRNPMHPHRRCHVLREFPRPGRHSPPCSDRHADALAGLWFNVVPVLAHTASPEADLVAPAARDEASAFDVPIRRRNQLVFRTAQHPQQRCRSRGDREGRLAAGLARPRPVPRRKPVPRPGSPALPATKPLGVCAAPAPSPLAGRAAAVSRRASRGGPRPRGFATRTDPVCRLGSRRRGAWKEARKWLHP